MAEETFTLDEMMATNSQSSDTFTLDEMSSSLNKNTDAVNLEKRHGTWDAVQTFFGGVNESVVKPVVRGVEKFPAAVESVYRVGLDAVRDQVRKQLIDDGVSFGAPEEVRTPEKQARIDRNNRVMESMNRAEDVSKRLSDNWINMSETGWEARDPKVWRGSFMENPSFVRAVGMGFESAPMLGLAATVSLATKSPTTGAAILGAIQASPQYEEMRGAGYSTNESLAMFGVNVAVLTALEKMPLEGFLKGGSFGVRTVRGVVQEGLIEEPVQQVWSNAVEKLGWNDTKSLFDGLVESVIAGSISGGVIGAAMPSNIPKIEKAIKNAEEKGVDIGMATDSVRSAIEDNIGVIKDDLSLNLNNPERMVEPAVEEKKVALVESKPEVPTPQSKMVEKQFEEEYEEPATSLDEFYKREYRAEVEKTTFLSSDPLNQAKWKKGRGFELSATLRQYRGQPTATEVKNELIKLRRINVGRVVDTIDGQGIVKKNPAYGKVQVEVNGKSKAYLMEDVTPPRPSKEDAIESLKKRAEKDMMSYLSSRGKPYSSEPVKRTRIVKKMVPAEEAPAPVEEPAPPVESYEQRSVDDEKVIAQELGDYLSSLEGGGDLIFNNENGEGNRRVVGRTRSARPKWWQDLDIPMERTTMILDKAVRGEELTETQQRDYRKLISGVIQNAPSFVQTAVEEARRSSEIKRLMDSGATEEEASDIYNQNEMVDEEPDLYEQIVDFPMDDIAPEATKDVAPILPVTGDMKPAKASVDVARKIVESGLANMSEIELTEIEGINKEQKIAAATEMIANDYERAKRIAFQEEDANIADQQIIYEAVKIKADIEGDLPTQLKLSKSGVAKRRSLMAQALGASGFQNKNESSAVDAIMDVENHRAKAVNEKAAAKEIKTEVGEIKKQTKQAVKKMDWDAFVKSLEC